VDGHPARAVDRATGRSRDRLDAGRRGYGLLVSGVLLDGRVGAADAAFSVRNGITEPGVVQPVAPERSGSPESQVPWTSLGRQGRSFTGTGPSAEQIAAFRDGPARTPIRAYAGLETAPTAEDRARVAVDDLARAGGFDRGTLVVVTTTARGGWTRARWTRSST